MRERPILFSGPMVQAIRAGKKTQTRRVVVPQPAAGVRYRMGGGAVEDGHGRPINPRYGVPPERLWVREAVRAWDLDGSRLRLEYRAGGEPREVDTDSFTRAQIDQVLRLCRRFPRYAPAMFCPRWAARTVLELTEVRVQRLQEISGDDIAAEMGWLPCDRGPGCTCAPDMFRPIWDRLNAKRGHGWDSNPWIWAISFRKLEAGEVTNA